MRYKPADSHNPELDLDAYVPALITFLANKLSSGASAVYRKQFGIGIVEWRILALLKIEHNISANRICQVIGLDKAAISRALKSLNAKQYLSFIKDENDARSSLINLTDKGIALHNSVYEVAIAREAILLEDLNSDEVETLLGLLRKLNAQVAKVNDYDPNL